MAYLYERRHQWSRIVGVERRGAPLRTLLGRPLPNPTRLADEDFQNQLAQEGVTGHEVRSPLPWRPRNSKKD